MPNCTMIKRRMESFWKIIYRMCKIMIGNHPLHLLWIIVGHMGADFVTRPWQRRRGSVALTGRPGTAKLQPGIRLQRTRGTIVPGPARSVGFWIGFAWYHETTFLPTNAAGRAVAHSYVSAMVSLMTHIYFKWIIYISHNFVWIHDVVKHNSRCASVCYDLKSWNTFWYSALLYLL